MVTPTGDHIKQYGYGALVARPWASRPSCGPSVPPACRGLPTFARRSPSTRLQGRGEGVVLLIGQRQLAEQLADRQAMLPQPPDRRMPPRLTSRALPRRPVRGDRLAQCLALIHQPAHLEQQLQLRLRQLVDVHGGCPKGPTTLLQILRCTTHRHALSWRSLWTT